MEDVLTSNVFSFLKYSNRGKCLRAYLGEELGLEVGEKEASQAEFRFWHVYDDGTEPDVIIIVGDYYLLFEAKYFSGFGLATDTVESQPIREVRNGLRESEQLRKEFLYVPVTADYYFRGDKVIDLPKELLRYVKGTSWQRFAAFLEGLLESRVLTDQHEREFASDLCELLDRKNLRGFHGYFRLAGAERLRQYGDFCFYDAMTSTSRGAFIGFAKTLDTVARIGAPERVLFMSSERELFRALQPIPEIVTVADSQLFWEVGNE
jgi:hypothetical protein